MPKRVPPTTKDFLVKVPLPNFPAGSSGRAYCTISHQHIIDTTVDTLKAKGLIIEKELYKATSNGEMATGVYHIKNSLDPEMGMLFAWANSYDKTMRFKSCVGGYVEANKASVISGDLSTWNRKHTGTALQEATDIITNQIKDADRYYNQLLADKKSMKEILVPFRQSSELLGRLFFEEGALTTDQMSIIKKELSKPSFDYNCESSSLWALYNHIILSLKKSHPKSWLDNQKQVHYILCTHFGIGNYTPSAYIPTVAVQLPTIIVGNTESLPGDGLVTEKTSQLDLEDLIKEVEKEKPVEVRSILKDFSEGSEVIDPGFTVVRDTPIVEEIDPVLLPELKPISTTEELEEILLSDLSANAEVISKAGEVLNSVIGTNSSILELPSPGPVKFDLLTPEERAEEEASKLAVKAPITEDSGLTPEEEAQIRANIEVAKKETGNISFEL